MALMASLSPSLFPRSLSLPSCLTHTAEFIHSTKPLKSARAPLSTRLSVSPYTTTNRAEYGWKVLPKTIDVKAKAHGLGNSTLLSYHGGYVHRYNADTGLPQQALTLPSTQASPRLSRSARLASSIRPTVVSSSFAPRAPAVAMSRSAPIDVMVQTIASQRAQQQAAYQRTLPRDQPMPLLNLPSVTVRAQPAQPLPVVRDSSFATTQRVLQAAAL